MKTAREWKRYYEAERAELGAAGLERLIDEAPPVRIPTRGALVFPHTRLSQSGALPAAVALALVRAGCEEVVALGVLHGAREQDAELVARARGGDAVARQMLRRVHGAGTPGDGGHWEEEFSLDGLTALVEAAARHERRRRPRIVARFPFLVGENPNDLPGLEELRGLLDAGCALVATADPIHHGAGYGTRERRPRESAETRAWARATVDEGFRSLARRDFAGFLGQAAEARSDFRDAGPGMMALLGPDPVRAHLEELVLVDYADALAAEPPTWVAGALATFSAAKHDSRFENRAR